MIAEIILPAVAVNEEIPGLIETLLATEQRLEELTSGQVDTVAGRDGRTFLLRRAQEQLRDSEAGKQAGILNALPAHIALLDTQGIIVSVNESWRRFADANLLHAQGHAVGLDYLAICDRARGDDSFAAHQVAAGIRAVLDGKRKSFSIEYPCHSPTESRWFLLTVTPFAGDHPNGAVVMHLNVTEGKEAEIAASRLAGILESSNDAIISKDMNNVIRSWNKRAENIFGYTDDEMVGTSILQLIPPEKRDEESEILRKIKLGESIEYFETQRLTKNRRLIDVSVTLSPIRDGEGNIIGVAKIARDITDRKLAETALRESEAEFRSLAEAMPQMVWITRPDGSNIYCSQQWMDYTGLTLEESLGHGWNKPFHPEDQQPAWDAWQRATATTGIYSIESRLRRADGAYRWWLIRGVPQQDTSGAILKWFGTCTDIHEMKLAELEISRANQALSESDEKFRQLADNITDVFWITSPDFKIVEYVSAGYELIWGHSVESLYADPHQWIEAILPEERENALAVFATLLGAEPEVSVEYRIARPDGTVRWICNRGFQVRDASGKLIRLTGICSDITEQKKLEIQLRQAQKMEAMGTLAGGIAHDFNNILAAIIGYSEMAQRGISPDIGPHAHLQQVLIASNRARDLVRQILTFSRQEEPERKPLELQPLIYETLSLVRVSLPPTIEIHQNIDTTAPSVLGDATQIQQAIMNLFVNAGQAMKERGGVLDVCLTRIDIDHDYATAHPELNEGPHVCLAVSDTGSGMDHATQGRIFEPFFTTKAPGEGTGLGLAVVHGIVKNHGGVIVVSSELRAGTTFSIYLPVYDRRHRALNQKSDPVPMGNGEHILFVDDEEALVSLGKSMLEDLGYRVTTRTDSIGALEVFKSQPEDFDLVITDQTMPHLSGADLARALLQTRPALPVILVTGYSSEINRQKAKAIGIRELLHKPNTMQALGEAIRRSLVQTEKE